MTLNPRGRDMVKDSPFTTRPAALPGLPTATTAFERAVKETLDLRTGGGNPHERWLTLRELVESGLKPGAAETVMPRDVLSMPVWVGRGRFVPVSLSALATSLQELMTLTTDTNAEALAKIRRRIADLPVGVSPSQLDTAIAKLQLELAAKWKLDIEAAAEGSDVAEAIEEIRTIAQNAAAQAQRVRGRTLSFASATVWTVDHGLNGYPVITVMNDAGEKIEPDVEYVTANQIVVTHGRATAGTVMLR